jgi:hypothetical protein
MAAIREINRGAGSLAEQLPTVAVGVFETPRGSKSGVPADLKTRRKS